MFSVLMALHKGESKVYFEEALDSVIRSTKIPSEVVIVVDGPIFDDLETIIQQCAAILPVKTVRLPENIGLGRALNAGLVQCSYPLVARFDTDDICAPMRFEKQLFEFKKDPDLKICGSWIQEFEDSWKNCYAIRKVPELHKEILKFAKHRNPFNHMSVMFSKAEIIALGGYPAIRTSQDYVLWGKALASGMKCYNIQECLVFARAGKDMHARRGGIAYAKNEVLGQYELLRAGLINWFEYGRNLVFRIPVRLLPTWVRGRLYNVVLRSKK